MQSNLILVLTASVLFAGGGNENTIQESQKLQGAWTVTSVVRNRNELPAEMLKGHQVIFRDGRFAFKKDDTTLAEGTFQLDLTRTPRTIDLTTMDADGKEKTTLAIYDLAEETLRICGAGPGEERPSEFAAMDGSGHTLTTFQRVK